MIKKALDKLNKLRRGLFEEEIKLEKIEEIAYPINIDKYRSYWDLWSGVREFISNAIDAENGNWNNINIETSPNYLIIHNKGRSLSIKDFYLGYSSQEKSVDKGYIGRFNEGMKFAIAVLLRMGYDVEIYFQDFYAIAKIDKKEHDLTTFKVEIYKNSNKVEGTLVKIKNVNGKEVEEMIRRNVLKPNDERVIYVISKRYPSEDEICDYKLRVIRDGGKVFVGGIFVSEKEDLSWGYDFDPIEVRISEGRNIFDMSDVRWVLSREMGKINSLEYWKRIFQDIKEDRNTLESEISLDTIWIEDSTIKTIRNAWVEIFGENAVVGDNDQLAAEASYRGAKIIKPTYLLKSLISVGAVPSCREFLEKYSQSETMVFEYEKLSDWEKSIYDIMKRVIERYLNKEWKLVIYEPLSENRKNEYGYTSHNLLVIGIRRKLLSSCDDNNQCKELVDTLLEEITHAKYNTLDTSREHTDYLRYLAAKFLTVDRKFILDSIEKMIEAGRKRYSTVL